MRDTRLARIGDEAQWCLFDPIVSTFYGRRFLRTGAEADWTRQISHFNRSLAQITHEWRCAELYYLRDQQYVANPHVPRQWTRQPAHVHTRHAEHGGAASAQQAGLTGNELRGRLPIANRSSQPRMVLTRGSFVVFV